MSIPRFYVFVNGRKSYLHEKEAELITKYGDSPFGICVNRPYGKYVLIKTNQNRYYQMKLYPSILGIIKENDLEGQRMSNTISAPVIRNNSNFKDFYFVFSHETTIYMLGTVHIINSNGQITLNALDGNSNNNPCVREINKE